MDIQNPEKIEIEGLKTIHKLCKFGVDHNMEGCSFTEIVERMFSKIEQMKTQVNTLDEILLNQGEALAQTKAKAVPDTYTPIVLALEDVQSKIAQASFLTMDADNENEVYAVDANELHEYIAELIETQEPAND